MKLVLMRHGESEWNKENLFTGWYDIDLSEKGVKEAKDAGKCLKKEGYEFDICYTSYLKRAIHTLQYILDEMDRNWLPVIKSWKLNERHYGALQGLNKEDTAKRYGEEQVNIWRRSFAICPPALAKDDARLPIFDPAYANVAKDELPAAESLALTIDRVVPYFEQVIKPQILAGKKVLITAHGNSLRALMKYLEHISDEDIVQVNIPTGVPLVYEFNEDFSVKTKFYIGNADVIKEKIDDVSKQGKVHVEQRG